MTSEASQNLAANDYIRFFSGEKNVPILHHAYLSNSDLITNEANGYQKWDNLVINRKEYYPFQEEKEILIAYRDDIQSIVGEAVHISSQGVGTRFSESEKTVNVMAAFDKILSYTAVDTSKQALTGGVEAINSAYPNRSFPVCTINGNMFDDLGDAILGTPHLSNISGCTIANFENSDQVPQKIALAKNLVAVTNNLPSGSHILIGYDRNTDEKSLLSAYDNQEMHELMLTSLQAISWSSSVQGFDPNEFDCVIKWESQISNIGFYAQPKSVQNFEINGQQITIDRERLMHIGNSAKISEKVMKEAINEASNQNGIELVRHYEIGTNRMAVAMIFKP